ncbi:sigma 54-interacting transcriptional regulator [Pseudoflavonifractor phocaeensis]|uniref:sigma 54-interacting transcriptional regulator n=1 Tax=Pseudoflavonifractor phocaeensis TaxID=1870988 RepID=UPI002FFBA920
MELLSIQKEAQAAIWPLEPLFVWNLLKYAASDRSDTPLVTVNCAAIAENLIESELCGYENGAFTGAVKGGKKGLIEEADGGTLFLDEINSLPLALQGKLLRALETRKIGRVGGVNEREVDFRLISASNRDLENCVEQGTFREDLFYRINVFTEYIPPLRQRREDKRISQFQNTQFVLAECQTKVQAAACWSISLPSRWMRAG